MSDSDSISYYFTLAAQLEIPQAQAFVKPLISASGISGNAHTYIYLILYIKVGCELLCRSVGRGISRGFRKPLTFVILLH